MADDRTHPSEPAESALREETAAVAGRRYRLRWHVIDDDRVSVFVSGRQDGAVVAELSAVLPQDDVAELGCLFGLLLSPRATVEQQPRRPHDLVRERHPNAYRPWRPEEEERLLALHRAGRSVAELAAELGRRPGGIRARLVRLGATEPPPPGAAAPGGAGPEPGDPA